MPEEFKELLMMIHAILSDLTEEVIRLDARVTALEAKE